MQGERPKCCANNVSKRSEYIYALSTGCSSHDTDVLCAWYTEWRIQSSLSLSVFFLKNLTAAAKCSLSLLINMRFSFHCQLSTPYLGSPQLHRLPLFFLSLFSDVRRCISSTHVVSKFQNPLFAQGEFHL
jgi:hypothetical protein